MSKGNNIQKSHPRPQNIGRKHDILHQNLNDLNVISERLLNDMKTRNSILQKGLNETKNNSAIVTNLKGGCK